MGKCRFLFSNFITDESMLAVSSLRTGIVTSALKEGTGSAILNPSGDYGGSTDLEYIVEIDSIAGGAEVGQATFKWSDGSGAWNAVGVTTSAVNITLNNGVQINWTTGSGADFVVGDRWYFKGINLFTAGKMLDLDRDHRYRSSAIESPNTITITLTAEQLVNALILYDHNLSSSTSIALWGDDAATFDSNVGAAQVIEAVTWTANKILHYLTTTDRTKRYWQIRITDTANTNGYIEIGELYLGSYLELSRNYTEGFERTTETFKEVSELESGISRNWYFGNQEVFELEFNHLLPADIVSMRALFVAISSRAAGQLLPFYLNMDSAIPADTWLVEIEELPVTHKTRSLYEMELELREKMASV